MRFLTFFIIFIFSANFAMADSITKPHTFTAGEKAKASEVNQNFDAVYDQVNKIGGVIHIDDANGRVGVGSPNPDEKLSVNGTIESTTGGIKFPDGTTQTTAASPGASQNGLTMTAGETITGGATPVPVFVAKEQTTEELKASQESYSHSYSIYGSNWLAQSFTTDPEYDSISKVEIFLYRAGNPGGNLEVSICDMSNDGPSSILGQRTIPADDVGLVADWVEIVFPESVKLGPGSHYAVVVSAPGGNAGNFLSCLYNSNDEYAAGNRWFSADGGSAWSVVSPEDCMFRVYGRKNPYSAFEGEEGRVYACDADDIDRIDFMGFATTAGVDGSGVNVQFRDVVSGFSGLSAGKKYYIQNIKGEIGPTPGEMNILVGMAVSPTELLIQKGKKKRCINFNGGASVNIPAGSNELYKRFFVGFRLSRIYGNVRIDTGQDGYYGEAEFQCDGNGVQYSHHSGECNYANYQIANDRIVSIYRNDALRDYKIIMKIQNVTESGFDFQIYYYGSSPAENGISSSNFHFWVEGD